MMCLPTSHNVDFSPELAWLNSQYSHLVLIPEKKSFFQNIQKIYSLFNCYHFILQINKVFAFNQRLHGSQDYMLRWLVAKMDSVVQSMVLFSYHQLYH